jgi:TPR repeat protein
VAKGKKILRVLGWWFFGLSVLLTSPLWGEHLVVYWKRASYYSDAVSGDAEAQYRLAYTYRSFTYALVRDDREAAFKWDMMAARQGHAGAMYYVARAYRSGYGAPLDQDKSDFWYKKAGELGNKDAQRVFEEILKKRALKSEAPVSK